MDVEQFLIDLVALCWFPVAHTDTFLKPLEVDGCDPVDHAGHTVHDDQPEQVNQLILSFLAE